MNCSPITSLICLIFVLVTSTASAEENQNQEESLRIILGGGLLSRPVYPGSDEQEIRALPLVSFRYQRFFLGGLPGLENGLGAYVYESDRWKLAIIGLRDVEEPRKESDDSNLQGLGDIQPTTHAGIYSSYNRDWLSLNLIVLSDIEDNNQGTFVNLGVRATHKPLPRLQVSAATSVIWADNERLQTFFGVDDQQSSHSIHQPYYLDSGIARIRFSIGARYLMTPHWGVGANITTTRLQDEVGESPVVQDKTQNVLGLFLMYRF